MWKAERPLIHTTPACGARCLRVADHAQAGAEVADLEATVAALEALMEPRRRLAKTLAGGSGDCGGRLRCGLAQPSLLVLTLAPSRMLDRHCLGCIYAQAGLYSPAEWRTSLVGSYKRQGRSAFSDHLWLLQGRHLPGHCAGSRQSGRNRVVAQCRQDCSKRRYRLLASQLPTRVRPLPPFWLADRSSLSQMWAAHHRALFCNCKPNESCLMSGLDCWEAGTEGLRSAVTVTLAGLESAARTLTQDAELGMCLRDMRVRFADDMPAGCYVLSLASSHSDHGRCLLLPYRFISTSIGLLSNHRASA